MNDSLRKALIQMDDAASNLFDADPGINSAARHARSLLHNLSNSLRYGTMYTRLMETSAVLVGSAVRREERLAADAANAATMLSMSADRIDGGCPNLYASRVQGGAPRIGSGKLV